MCESGFQCIQSFKKTRNLSQAIREIRIKKCDDRKTKFREDYEKKCYEMKSCEMCMDRMKQDYLASNTGQKVSQFMQQISVRQDLGIQAMGKAVLVLGVTWW